jgi:Flp pilus assembly protein TadD
VELLKDARPYYPGDWLIELRYADALRAVGHKAEALDAYKRAILKNTGDPMARLHYGQLLEETGDLTAARDQYYQGTKIQPANGELLGSLGTVLVKLGQYADAQLYLAEASAHGYSAYRYHLALGILAGRQGKLQEAAGEFASAVQEDPNGWEAQFNLGQALLMLQQPDEARGHLLTAHQLRPQSVAILETLARLERGQSHTAKAAEYERQARALGQKAE